MERTPKGIYTPEFRAEAVKLVESTGMSVGRAAKRLSMRRAAWTTGCGRHGKAAGGSRQGQRLPSELELELARTRKELADVKMERDLLKSCDVFREGVAVKYGRIDELRQTYPVAAMCRLLDVSESGYHAWRKRPPSPRAQANARLEVEIKAAHERTRQTYGPERLQADLADNGIHVGIHRIKRIRQKLGLRCRQKRKFKATTDSKHNLPVAPNLLDRQFAVAAPNKCG